MIERTGRRMLDTRQKLRERLLTLSDKVAEELEKLPAKQLEKKLDGMKTLTNLLSVLNREPDEKEGAQIHEFRERLDRASGRGGSAGPEPDGEPGDGDADPPADDGTEPANGPDSEYRGIRSIPTRHTT